MRSLLIVAFAAQALAVVMPRNYRSTTEGGGITRSFTLPPLPIETGWPWKREPEGMADAEPEPEPEFAPEEKREQFGTGPDPSQVQITGITYGGTGCPSNTIASAISADRTVMTLIFSDYVASIGPGITVTESRKNCQMNVQLQYPGGFQYSIFSATYRGYADLDKGVSGKQQSTYYFSGQTAQVSTGTSWTGPYVNDYELTDQAVSASIVWSPCGQQGLLNINSQVSLTSSNSSASGFLTTDSVDTSFVQQVYIQWQPCKATTTTTSKASKPTK